jgi:hypothetical protein
MEVEMFKRRVGKKYHRAGPNDSSGLNSCPDVWELEDGSFAIIGLRKTAILKANLPASANCGPDEEIVVLPRTVFLDAAGDV